jgi:hypothetical protein
MNHFPYGLPSTTQQMLTTALIADNMPAKDVESQNVQLIADETLKKGGKAHVW